jgi:hypothetical protein
MALIAAMAFAKYLGRRYPLRGEPAGKTDEALQRISRSQIIKYRKRY